MEESTKWHSQQIKINESFLENFKGISGILGTMSAKTGVK